MRTILIVASAALFLANNAFAASCTEQATEKKLAGAAKESFMKKCEAGVQAAAVAARSGCEASAAEKKLAGAARDSFMKKCEADAKK